VSPRYLSSRGDLGARELIYVLKLTPTISLGPDIRIKLTQQAKVRLQAKSSKSKSSKPQPPTLGPILTTEKEKHGETYADIASHPADPSAPVVTHNPDLDLEIQKQLPLISKKGEDGGAIELLTRVYREKGVGGWYKGLGAQIVKAVLCQGMSPFCSSLSSSFLSSVPYSPTLRLCKLPISLP
jgi:hypothetical protein